MQAGTSMGAMVGCGEASVDGYCIASVLSDLLVVVWEEGPWVVGVATRAPA